MLYKNNMSSKKEKTRHMVRIEPETRKFMEKRLSPSICDADKLSYLVRIGVEMFDIIDELKKSVKDIK